MKVLLLFVILLVMVVLTKSNFGSIDYPKIQKQMLLRINVSTIPTDERIPKVVHKIYIDSTMKLDSMDPVIYSLFDKLKSENPGYSIKLWSGNDCREYLIKNFDSRYIKT